MPAEQTFNSWRRARWAMAVGVVLILAGLGLFTRFSNEPRIDGKSLSDWLVSKDPEFLWMPNDVYGHIHDELWDLMIYEGEDEKPVSPSAPAPLDPQTIAIKKMGSACIPFLEKWSRANPSRGDQWRASIARRIPRKWGERLDPALAGMPRHERLRVASCDGFRILGEFALPILPTLSNTLFQVHSDLTLTWAIAGMGPQGQTVLAHAIRNGDPKLRENAALALGLEGTVGAEAMEALVRAVESGDRSYHVLGALGRLRCADPRLTRSLTQHLDSAAPLTPFRMEVLLLGLQRSRAVAALPAMERRHREAGEQGSVQDMRLLRRAIRAISAEAEKRLPPIRSGEDGDHWPD